MKKILPLTLITLISITSPSYSDAKRVAENPETCAKVNGTWHPEQNKCEYPILPDGGKECSKHTDCKGLCIVELTAVQERLLIKEFGQHQFKAHGKCSAELYGPDCMPSINAEGMVDSIICN